MKRLFIPLVLCAALGFAVTAITGAQLQNITDCIAWQYDKIDSFVGKITGTGTLLYAMQQNVDSIRSYVEDVTADLNTPAVYEKNVIVSWKYDINKYLTRGLENHLRRTVEVGISDYWQDSLATRIAPGFAILARSIGIYLEDSIVFPPKTNLAMIAITAAHTCTVRDSNVIDLAKYGDANLLVYVKNAATTCTCSLTVTGKDRHGTTITGLAVLSAAADGDTVLVVPTEAGLKFYDITTATVRNGANLDTLLIKTRFDRNVTY